MMPHGKHLLLGATGLVKGRLGRIHPPLNKLSTTFNQLLAEQQWLRDAPFDTIHYCFRFGAQRQEAIYYEPVSRKYQELPVASVLAMDDLRPIHLLPDAMYPWLHGELVRVLRDIQARYHLPELSVPPIDSNATGNG